MALVATCGATTGAFASNGEAQAAACARKLEQAENLEFARREALLYLYFDHARWSNEYDIHKEQGRDLLRRANDIRASARPLAGDPDPDVLDTDAQVEFAVARVIRPLKDFSDAGLPQAATLEAALTTQAERDLRGLGIKNRCDSRAPTVTSSDSYLGALERDIASIHHSVAYDSIAVIIFVFVLVLSTTTEIVPVPSDFRQGQHSLPFEPRVPGDPWERWRILIDLTAFLGLLAAVILAIAASGWTIAVMFAIALAVVLTVAQLQLWITHGHGSTATWLRVQRARMHLPLPARAVTHARTADRFNSIHEDAVPHEREVEITRESIVHVHYHGAHHVARNPIGRIIVILIAVTALFSAIVETYHSYASSDVEQATANAAVDQVQMLRSATLREASSYYAVHQLVAAREARLRSLAASFWRFTTPTTDSALWTREADRWSLVADRIVRLEPLNPHEGYAGEPFAAVLEGENGPYLDSSFPSGYVVRTTVAEPAERLATWDAADTARATHEQRASVLFGAVALFGIALYLFGQSLGAGHTNGSSILSLFAVGVFVSGLVLAVTGLFQHAAPHPRNDSDVATAIRLCSDRVADHDADELAAMCYAKAETLALLARTSRERRDAADLYRLAATLRPGFALADYRNAQIASKIATPQQTTPYVSIVARSELERMTVRDDAVKADLDARGFAAPQPLVENTILHHYLSALNNNDRALLHLALQDAFDVLAVEPFSLIAPDRAETLPLRFRLALMLLADRREKDALKEYSGAYNDPAAAANPALIDSAITDLELLRTRCETLSWFQKHDCERLTLIVDSLVASMLKNTWQKAYAGSELPFPAQPALDITPSVLSWRIPDRRPLIEEPGTLVMVVWKYDKDWSTWYVLPELTRSLDPVKFQHKNGSITYYTSELLSSGNTDCIDMNGKYRVQIYRDGELVSTGERDVSRQAEAFSGVALHDPGVALCYPSLWNRLPSNGGALAAGYADAKRERGTVSYAFFSPRVPATPNRLRLERHAIGRAMALTAHFLNPTVPSEASVALSSGSCLSYFTEPAPHQTFLLGRTLLLAKAWQKPDGLISVGVVWQPVTPGALRKADRVSCQVLTSMTELDHDSAVVENVAWPPWTVATEAPSCENGERFAAGRIGRGCRYRLAPLRTADDYRTDHAADLSSAEVTFSPANDRRRQ